MAVSFLFRSTLKVGLVGGATYATLKEGIWGTSEQSIEAYERLVNVLPGTKEYTDKLRVQIPINDYVNLKEKSVPEYWNSGVIYVFAGLVALPNTTAKYSKLAFNKAEEFITKTLK